MHQLIVIVNYRLLVNINVFERTHNIPTTANMSKHDQIKGLCLESIKLTQKQCTQLHESLDDMEKSAAAKPLTLFDTFAWILIISNLLDERIGHAIKIWYSTGNFQQPHSCGIVAEFVLDAFGMERTTQEVPLQDLKTQTKNALFVLEYTNADHIAMIYYYHATNSFYFFQSFVYQGNSGFYDDADGYFLHEYFARQHLVDGKVLKPSNTFKVDIDLLIEVLEKPNSLKDLSLVPPQFLKHPQNAEFVLLACAPKITPAKSFKRFDRFVAIQENNGRNFKDSLPLWYAETRKLLKDIVLSSDSDLF